MPHENGVSWDGDHLCPRLIGYAMIPILRVVYALVQKSKMRGIMDGYDAEKPSADCFALSTSL